MFDKDIINKIKEYAKEENVPIMTDEGIEFLEEYISKNNVSRILEIGAAIGYSAIMMCSINDNITVTTIERDHDRYIEAVKNIKSLNLEDRINLIYGDALDANFDGKYDLIFIDAAKAQNKKFFEKFKDNLDTNGTIITDNMNFHGLVNSTERIESRNLRQLVRKINDYREFLKENKEFKTEFLDLGDGVAISKRVED